MELLAEKRKRLEERKNAHAAYAEKLKKNFYKAKVYYRRRYQVEKRKVFQAELKEKAYQKQLNHQRALDQQRVEALEECKRELKVN